SRCSGLGLVLFGPDSPSGRDSRRHRRADRGEDYRAPAAMPTAGLYDRHARAEAAAAGRGASQAAAARQGASQAGLDCPRLSGHAGGIGACERVRDAEEVMALVRLTREEARGKLPLVCVCCGGPAAAFRTKISWYPPWANVFCFAFFVPLILLIKRIRLTLPFCSEDYAHWPRRALIVWGSLACVYLFPLGMMLFLHTQNIGGYEIEEVLLPIVCAGTALLWVILSITVQYMTVRPWEVTKQFIVVSGGGPALVEALEVVETREFKSSYASD